MAFAEELSRHSLLSQLIFFKYFSLFLLHLVPIDICNHAIVFEEPRPLAISLLHCSLAAFLA